MGGKEQRLWSLITICHSKESGLLGEGLTPVLGQEIYKRSPVRLILESKEIFNGYTRDSLKRLPLVKDGAIRVSNNKNNCARVKHISRQRATSSY